MLVQKIKIKGVVSTVRTKKQSDLKETIAQTSNTTDSNIHVCPVCLRPWFDVNGKFAACKRCPFRAIETTRTFNDTYREGR